MDDGKTFVVLKYVFKVRFRDLLSLFSILALLVRVVISKSRSVLGAFFGKVWKLRQNTQARQRWTELRMSELHLQECFSFE